MGLFDPSGTGPDCGCDHIDSANRVHCPQSIEGFDAAQSEGFGHFYAAKIFNDRPSASDCEFVYYKEVLVDECPVDRTDCVPSGDQFVVPPPNSFSCADADKFRNNRCAAFAPAGAPPDVVDAVAAANATVARRGPERDWLQFMRSWNTGPTGTPLVQIGEAFKQTCNPGQCIDPVTGKRNCILSPCTQFADVVVWSLKEDDPMSRRSMSDGVLEYFNTEAESGDPNAEARLTDFLAEAVMRGVDESLAP